MKLSALSACARFGKVKNIVECLDEGTGDWVSVPNIDTQCVGEYQYSDDHYDYYKFRGFMFRVSQVIIRPEI